MALAQKFDVVLESHRFLYEFHVLSTDMSHYACRQTYVLDSIRGHVRPSVGWLVGHSNV